LDKGHTDIPIEKITYPKAQKETLNPQYPQQTQSVEEGKDIEDATVKK
jgi:hypothetical protein